MDEARDVDEQILRILDPDEKVHARSRAVDGQIAITDRRVVVSETRAHRAQRRDPWDQADPVRYRAASPRDLGDRPRASERPAPGPGGAAGGIRVDRPRTGPHRTSPRRARPSGVAVPRGFPARYAGVCARCHALIEPGQIVQAARGWDRATDEAVRHRASYRGLTPLRWQHADCPSGGRRRPSIGCIGMFQLRRETNGR